MKRNYEEEAKRLSQAIDIAIESMVRYTPIGMEGAELDRFVDFYKETKASCFNPDPKFRSLASLKYSIDDIFTYFQEAHGPAVEYFWQKIKAADLGYVRVNRMQKILKRKRIASQVEYDFVIDTMIPYHQQEMISEEELAALKEMVGAFETKKRR